MESKIYLYENFFEEKEKTVALHGELKAAVFTYSTGVKAVRLSNSKGSIILLPYMGQMIWRAEFNGYEMAMKSIYDEPMPAKEVFGETYGCFLMHCGLTAMGNPTAEDSHLPHGELPVCKYNEVFVLTGEDANGEYIALSGVYSHKRCFELNYDFSPIVKLYAGKTYIDVSVSFKNNKDVPLEYYYLCHINHRPVNGARLLYTAKPSEIKVNHEVPADYFSSEHAKATNCYLDALDKDPSIMNEVGAAGQSYKPEIVFCCNYDKDEDGNAYTMQLNPDKTATFVCHKPDELPYGIRWIARTEDEDAMGMVLPATAEHLGRCYCRRNNQQSYLRKGETVTYSIRTGLLDAEQSEKMQEKIKSMGY